MRHKRARRVLGFDFLRSFAKGQRLGLSKYIRQENVVVMSQRSERVAKRDKVTWDKPRALMNQLIERVLASELYEQRGREDGRALQDWGQAEREIRKDKPHK